MTKEGNRHRFEGIRLMSMGLLMVLLLVMGSPAFSQRISATLDRDKIVLGEQVTLQLKAEDINPRTSFVAKWFALPDSVNHLSIIKTDPLDTVDVNGLTTFFQHITITSYDSGKWTIPLQPLVLQDKVTGKQTILKPDSVYLQVLPVDVSGLKDYHDIKEIIDVPAKTDYTLWIAAAISIVIVTILLILFFRRKKQPVVKVPKPVTSERPLEEALRKLKELEKEDLPAKGQVKLFYTRLDGICREYFTQRLRMQAMQLTTDEIMISLGIYLQDKQAKTSFYQSLRLVNAVKFAKYIPGPEQNAEALKLTTAGLQHIDNQIQLASRHAN